MKTKPFLASLIFCAAAAAAYEAAIPYFARSRNVSVGAPATQSYIIVDSDIWKFSHSDLSDIRLYDGDTQLPYALVKQSGGSSKESTSARILNLGSVAGHTEFDLDVTGIAEYDQVRLQLNVKNFINRAQIGGRKALTDRSGVNLGGTTLYDFTAEGLGSNSNLKFAAASFPYLHIRLASGIHPNQVKGAYLSNFPRPKRCGLRRASAQPSADWPSRARMSATCRPACRLSESCSRSRSQRIQARRIISAAP